jgi:hypothetical protein
MEILKRAKGHSGELVAFNENEANVREEVHRRAAKAGYCTREGNPTHGAKIQGPGIGQSKLNVWLRDEQGNLIGD